MPLILPLKSPKNREWRFSFLDRVILIADHRFPGLLEEGSSDEATASHTPKRRTSLYLVIPYAPYILSVQRYPSSFVIISLRWRSKDHSKIQRI